MAEKDGLTQQASVKRINIAAFAIFSFVPHVLFYVALSAAEDILAGTEIPTSAVYLCSASPYTLVTLLLPIFVDKMPHLSLLLATFVFETFGVVFLAVLEDVNVKLVGVCIISLASGVADVSFLSWTPLHGDVTVQAYAAGAGVGIAISVIYYAGATTWFCVSRDTALMMIMWLPLLLPIFYCLMDKKSSDQSLVSKPTNYEDVPYITLHSNDQENQEEESDLTLKDKLKIMWKNMPLFIPFNVGAFLKYLMMQAVVTGLAFLEAPFEPRDHYQYYLLANVVGEVTGESCALVMYFFNSNLQSYTRHTWILAFLMCVCVLFLVFASWFRFLHNVWVVIFITFFVGVKYGVLYNCTFAAASHNTSSSKHKGFSRAVLTAAMGTGILSGSSMGLYIEPLLKEHCFYISENSVYCLTRLMQTKSDKCLLN